MSTVRQRVANGVRFLNKHRPGWQRKINPRKLDLKSPCNCILGQLEGSYLKGVEKYFDWDDEPARKKGFEWNDDNPDRAMDEDYAELTTEWLRYLAANR